MSSLKQKSVQCYASIPESRYSRPPSAGPLPFRSRHAANQSGNQPDEHHVKWQDRDVSPRTTATTEKRSSSSNETVKSWLLSTSPTSVIEQAQGERDPPTPPPICSPSPSSPVLSPRPPTNSKSEEASSELEPARIVRTVEGLPSGSKNFRKNMTLQNADALPDSPTGSSGSSVSEGGLLALLANKLFSYKDHSRPSSRYSRERSGPIDDKHVVEDRSSKPPVEEFHLENSPQPEENSPQRGEAQPSNDRLDRMQSEAASDLSIGSANDRTLSMEFDAILAAAVAAGVTSALGTEGRSTVSAEGPAQRADFPGIQDNSSLRSACRDTSNSGSQGRIDERRGAEIGSTALVTPFALAAAQRGGDVEDASTVTVTEMALSSQSSSRGSRWIGSEQTDNDSLSVPSSGNNSSRGSALGLYPDAENSTGSKNDFKCNSLVLALADDRSHDANSLVSPSSSEGSSKENIAPNSGRQALDRVRRDKILAQVAAFQIAKNSKYENRYKREEAKIKAWENQQRIKAAVAMKKAEMKLEEKRAKALEKMENDIASAHKRAEERKASAEAVRGMKAAKVAVLTDNMRQMGKVSGGCFHF